MATNHVVSKALLDRFAVLEAKSREGIAFDDAMKALSPYLWAVDGDAMEATEDEMHSLETKLETRDPLVLTVQERAVYDGGNTLYEASSPMIKAALKGLWQELMDEGVTPEEFDGHYADATYDGPGEDSDEKEAARDWLDALGIKERVSRHLAEVKKRHLIGGGKSWNLNSNMLRRAVDGTVVAQWSPDES